MSFDVPVILLKNVVVLPNQEVKIELNNIISGKTVNEAMTSYKGEILVVTPVDALEEEPSVDDLPKVGVIVKIKNKIDNNGCIQVRLRGLKRVAVNRYFQKEKKEILYSNVMYIDLPSLVKDEEEVIIKKMVTTLKEYIGVSKGVSNDILSFVGACNDLNRITDAVASFLPISTSKKLDYMQEINPIKRAKSLIRDMKEEIRIVELDNELEETIDEHLQKEQREFYLKEKLNVIKEELGQKSWKEDELEGYRKKLASLKIDKKIKLHFQREIDKYEFMNDSSPEASVARNYIEWVLNLPWNKKSKENANFNKIYEELNKSHYGLEKIKTRITEYIAIKTLNKDIESPIICLVGPPGVGKTSIAYAISKALNREFYKVSVGGLNDSFELVGARRTYLASSPGKIIQGINKCGVNNPVILIDEVDKMIRDYKGDPAATLLEILDPVQNKYFVDNYIEEPFDLSDVLFILTANSVEDIPSPLLDRVELIEINSYTLFEKKDIVIDYLLPKILKENMVFQEKIKFSDELIYFIINGYTKEAGLRELTRVLASLARKITINNVKQLNEQKIIKLLGDPLYKEDSLVEFAPGAVNIMAYTPVGGKISRLEVVLFKGTEKINITGNVGKVMEESANVALSMVKSKYKYNFHNYDIHIHFLSAGVKKDGPSAGLSIAIALVSLMENKKVSPDIAFTGEITLQGNILKIGGLKEKLIGAYNRNVKVVYIPKENQDDLKNIPKEILKKMDIELVSNFDEVYTKIFK